MAHAFRVVAEKRLADDDSFYEVVDVRIEEV